MPISMNSNITQLHKLHRHTSLLQEEVRAIIVHGMVACLGRLQQGRDLLEIDKLSRRLGLEDASSGSGAGVVHDLGLERRNLVGCGWEVREWDVGETVDTCAGAGEDTVDEGGSGGLNADDGFDETWGGVGDDPWDESTLRVCDEDCSANFLEESNTGGLHLGLLNDGVGLELDV